MIETAKHITQLRNTAPEFSGLLWLAGGGGTRGIDVYKNSLYSSCMQCMLKECEHCIAFSIIIKYCIETNTKYIYVSRMSL